MKWTASPALALAALGLLAGCLGIPTDSDAPIDIARPGTWNSLAPMPSERQEVAVAALDGKVYVLGGLGDGAAPVATVEVYDPARNAWEARAPLPLPLHHPAAAVVEGRLYVVGGYTGGRVNWTAHAGLYEHDAAADAWVARPPMPTPRGALAAAAIGGRLHAVGGAADSALAAHEVYEPATGRWRAALPMTVARDHLAAVALDGRLWAIGGRSSFMGTQYATVEIYDPASDAWSGVPPLPNGRGGLAAAVAGGRLFVLGGESPSRIFSAVDMYDAAGGRWIGKAAMPTPRHGIGAAVVDGRLYVPGGGTRPGLARTAAHERYTP